MGVFEFINELRQKWFGYNEEDVYKFIAKPTPAEIEKLLKDKKTRQSFYETATKIAKQKNIDPNKALPLLSYFILKQAKDNNIIKSDLFTTPNLRDYEKIIGLDEIARIAFNEKTPGGGFVRILTEFGVGERISKKDYDKFVANVRNTIIQAYKVHETVETIDRALDFASDLSLVLGVGGLAIKGGLWLGRRALFQAVKENLTRSFIQKIATGLNTIAGISIKAGDIAFIGSELSKTYVNTVVKDLPLSYSLDHLLVSGLGVGGYFLPKTKRAQQAISRVDTLPVNFEDVKHAIVENKVPLTGSTLDFKPKEIAEKITGSLRNQIAILSQKRLSKEQFTSLQTFITRASVEALQNQLDTSQSLLIAHAIAEPNVYKTKIQNVYNAYFNFIKTYEDEFKRLADSIGIDEEAFSIVLNNKNLFEHFKTNTSRALYNRIVSISDEIKDLQNVRVKLGDDIVALSVNDVFSNEFVKAIEDYVDKALKNKRLGVVAQFVDDAGNVIKEVGLPTIYIPTYDFAKVIHLTLRKKSQIVDEFITIPNTLLQALRNKYGDNYDEIYRFLSKYITEYLKKGEEVVSILRIYDPATQLFPSTIVRELGLSKLRVIDEVFGIFPKDELESLGLKAKGRVSELKDFVENLNKIFQEKAKHALYTTATKNLKELRAIIKELLNKAPKDKTRTIKLIEELQTKLDTFENKENIISLIDEVKRLLPLQKELKAEIKDKDAISLADKLIKTIQQLDKALTKLPERPIDDLKTKLIEILVYKHPSEFRKFGQGFVDVKTLYELDPDLARAYLAKTYSRLWTFEERWLTNVARYTDDILFSDPTLQETTFIKALKLIRDYQGADTIRGQWLHFLSKLSKLYTMFLPRVAVGAGAQIFSAIAQKYPSFRFFTAPIDTTKEIISNPELRQFLVSQLKETLDTPHHYLSFWIRVIEPFMKTIFYNELMKNQKFREEVLRDFIKAPIKDFTPQVAHILSEMLTNLIDSPVALSPFMGGKLEKLAYIQSWFPFVVAPFQIALHATADIFKSPKHFVNYFKHLLIGSTILPATIAPISGVIDTVKYFYENLSSVYHLASSILTGNPEPLQSYLEKNEPTLAKLWKEFFSYTTQIPKDELTGRLFHDLGLVLTLHGDNVVFDYVRAGLDFLAKHVDISKKNIFSPGSVSTSFEVTIPVINTVLDLLNTLFVYGKEQPEQASRALIEKLQQLIPIAKNIKSGILSELSQYGNVSNDTILKVFTDEELAKLTGISYYTGVMVKHPQAVAKIFDTMFLGGFGEAIVRIGTGKTKEILFLPKVSDVRSYQLKILGNEEYVLRSLHKIEDPYTKKQILLRFANVMDNYFDIQRHGKKHRDTNQDLNMLKSYLTFLSAGSNILEDEVDINYMLKVANKAIVFLKQKHNIDNITLRETLMKFFDDIKLRRKIASHG